METLINVIKMLEDGALRQVLIAVSDEICKRLANRHGEQIFNDLLKK